MADPCYVYAILPSGSPLPAGLIGLAGAQVIAVPCDALAAAVSFVEGNTVLPTPDNLWRHEEVVEALQLAGPLLPARFGTVLAGVGGVVEAVARRYAHLLGTLARIGDKVELGIAVLWPPESMDGGQPGSGKDGEAGGGVFASGGEGSRYLGERKVELRRAELRRTRALAVAREIGDAVGPQVLESSCTIRPTARLALSVAYLLEPAQVGAFRQSFERLRSRYPGFHFLLSGPWPPYSFVSQSNVKQAEESIFDDCRR